MNKKQIIIFATVACVLFVMQIISIVVGVTVLSEVRDLQSEQSGYQPQRQNTQPNQPQDTQPQDNQDTQEQNNQHQDPNQQHTQDNQQHTQDAQPTQPMATQAATVENGNVSAAVVAEGDSWDSRGKKATRVSIVVTNNGDQPISTWTVTIDVPAGAQIENGWNGEFKIDGTKLTVTDTSGRTLNKGDSYPDAGFIILTDSPFVPS